MRFHHVRVRDELLELGDRQSLELLALLLRELLLLIRGLLVGLVCCSIRGVLTVFTRSVRALYI